MPDRAVIPALLRRVVKGGAALAVGTAAVALPVVALEAAAPTPAGAARPAVTYLPGTPSLATITSPAGCSGTACAPWNDAQGTADAPAYPVTDLLPTYTPGGSTTSTGEPNVAVYPGATSGTDTTAPYPAGTVGTPGPLDDYCGPGTHAAESTATSTPSRQPAGTTLPFSPAYFPHVVKNPDGTLTGYFDERPKTANEALVAATATATGTHWTYQGEALQQNPGYCPSSDVNDDGEGHADLLTVDGKTYLYTLPRAAGDMQGVGLVVHQFDPSETAPLAGLPADEKTGIDPDAFVPTGTATETVTHGTAVAIDLTTTGTTGSPEQLVPGGFVDLTTTPIPTAASVITCTGVTATSLTGCTTPSGDTVAVHAGDLVEQVLGFVAKKVTVPVGPNKTTGDGGLSKITVVTTSGGSTKGFTDALTGSTFNTNAPNRAYVDGVAVYCNQANTNPTTKIETCTTGPGGSKLAVPAGAPITTDPIVPATADDVAAGDGMTSGLVAPDGIVGTLPGYPGAPAGSTIVMYTEKELDYFVAGVTPKTTVATTPMSVFGSTVPFTPGPYEAQDMPATISAQTPVTVSMGDMTTKSIIPVTCTGLTTGTAGGTDTLTGCSVPAADAGNRYTSSSWIGAPGATTVPYSTLELTGEGKTTPKKLMKNNEDLTVLRVAYTTTGTAFRTTGLANGGVISATRAASTGGSYRTINDPYSTADPTSATGAVDLNEYATAGTPDATELRWVGSDGTIVTNPNGTYGLFLSGSWAADGDSDAFNQIFYSQSSTGEQWSVPRMVLSTDYTFSASQREETALGHGQDVPLTVRAYYEGRAYGPSVVQNANGTLTMVFAGYQTPKGMAKAGDTLGTGYGGAPQWTVGPDDPALYRNILTVTLRPTVPTIALTQGTPTSATVTTATSASYAGALSVTDATGPVTYAVTTPAASTALRVAATGAVTTSGTLAAGTYTVSGTDRDPLGDTGTWSFTLTVTPVALVQGAPTSGTVVAATSASFTAHLSVPGAPGPVTFERPGPAGTGWRPGPEGTGWTGPAGTGRRSGPEGTGRPGLTASATGTVRTTGWLRPGSYTVSGTDRDSYGDTGTWTYTLEVEPNPPPEPVVGGFGPASGPTRGGTEVVISGAHLEGASAVHFGATTAASVVVLGPTLVLAVTRAHAAGPVAVSVTTPGGTTTAPGTFTFVAPPPPVPPHLPLPPFPPAW